jgi:DNA-binding NarL/FixJ family response regulator
VLGDYVANHHEGTVTAFERLTLREKEVLQLAAEGKTTRDIAEVLYLSVKTTEKHRATMMHKLGLRSTSELIKYATSRGLIHIED